MQVPGASIKADTPARSLDAGSFPLASMRGAVRRRASVAIALCDGGVRQRRHRVGEFGAAPAKQSQTPMHRISVWRPWSGWWAGPLTEDIPPRRLTQGLGRGLRDSNRQQCDEHPAHHAGTLPIFQSQSPFNPGTRPPRRRPARKTPDALATSPQATAEPAENSDSMAPRTLREAQPQNPPIPGCLSAPRAPARPARPRGLSWCSRSTSRP
jgi:hypothetical protein